MINKILQNHAGWLWSNGQYEKAMDCLKSANPEHDKRCHRRIIITRDKNGRFAKNEKIKSS